MRTRTISRFLLAALLSAGVLAALGQNSPPPNKPPALPCRVADGFTIAAVGDLIFSEPLSDVADEPLKAILKPIRAADAAFGNLENTLIDLESFRGYPQAEYGIPHLLGSPAVAKDMRNMGFTLVSRANNHTTDWGIEGMHATDQAADNAGLVRAGTGDNRAAARAAHYLPTTKGRISLVAMTSTPTPISPALDPLGRSPGRPGLSALRVTPTAIVSPEMMLSLRKIHDAQPAAKLESEATVKRVLGLPDKPDEISLLGTSYRVGDKPVRLAYEMNDLDFREILKSIRQGKQNSDFLIASIHAHESDNSSEETPDFLPRLAHAAIDAGADMLIGHGPHRLRGIEIYKGKPIFYSLGNFFFQLGMQEPITAELYESAKMDLSALTEHDFMALFLKVMFDAPVWYQSVIAVSRFEQGRVAEVRLYPVDLGYKDTAVKQGIPRPATPAVGKAILEDLQRLSKPFGTAIAIEDGVGIIRLGPHP